MAADLSGSKADLIWSAVDLSRRGDLLDSEKTATLAALLKDSLDMNLHETLAEVFGWTGCGFIKPIEDKDWASLLDVLRGFRRVRSNADPASSSQSALALGGPATQPHKEEALDLKHEISLLAPDDARAESAQPISPTRTVKSGEDLDRVNLEPNPDDEWEWL